MIEYVLMLIITVSIIIALMNQIFKPFGEFVQSYMGSYVACLLEYGELPSMGGEGSPADEDSECNQKFKAATLADGRPPKNGSSASSSSDSKKDGATNSDGSGGAGGSSSGSGSYAGSASRRGSSFIGNGRGPSSGVESGGARAGDGKVVEVTLDGGGGGGFFRSSKGTNYAFQGRRIQSVPVTGITEAEKKKLEKKAEGANKVVINTDEGFAPAPKKIPVKTPEKPTVLEEEKPLTIGNFIRYLFIAALVIALVIFIGGQAVQMSKNYEK